MHNPMQKFHVSTWIASVEDGAVRKMWILLLISLEIAAVEFGFARGIDVYGIDFAHRYFKEKNVSRVTSALCWEEGNILLYKKFSDSKIPMNNLNFDGDVVSILTSKYLKLGILLDLTCGGAYEILQIAQENDLFVQTKSLTVWLLLLENYVSEDYLKLKASLFRPEEWDPVRYLLEPYLDTNNSDLLAGINRRANAEFIERYERAENSKSSERSSESSNVDVILSLNLLLDNQALLAVPGQAELYHLYAIYKVKKESRMKIVKSGNVVADGERAVVRGEAIPERKSLEGAVLRGVAAIYSPRKFTSLNDLSTRDIDAWTKMTYGVFELLKDELNFSIIIRFFDDYGWKRDDGFNGLMGHLERRKADLSASYLLFRDDRYAILDYLDSPFRLQTGILFREPSLSSVRNIFLLPFTPAVWISVILSIGLIVAVLACETAAGRRYKWFDVTPGLTDVVFFVLAAVGQQGCHSPPVSTTGRLIFFLLLFTRLALFTAFSAKIVTVMQSFSTSILTVDDITASSFEVGIQPNFPLFDVALKEALPFHEVIREFYYKKISRRRGSAYFPPEDGIEKIRRGLFAYEVDLTVGYKIISDTYEEKDKCGLKEIDAFTKPYLGAALPKNSPFRESFIRRLSWQSEAGLMDRTWKRWIPQKPKCEAGRIGFISVGLTESYSAVVLFAYGFAASVSIFVLEFIYYKIMSK